MKYRYKMKDMDCSLCIEQFFCPKNSLCPYIMENLSDLFVDVKFREAVKNAKQCTTHHKNTLKFIRKYAYKQGNDLFYEVKPPRHSYKPECAICNYPSHGFICYSEKDGSCLKDWIRSRRHAGIC